MSNIKRVISMLLAAAMILSMSTFVAFAEDSTTNEEAADAVLSSAAGTELASMPNDDVQYADAYKFDYSMGLFEMLEDGYWQNEKVTRAEFATIVAKMLKSNTAGYPRYGSSPYVDIDASNFAYSSVCYLTEIGILSGDGNSEFRPNDPILVNEASKMIMCALGYQDACEITNGGFPNGYTTFALRQGIYNGLSLSYTDSMTAMQMAKMVRNAMEAYLMETVVYRADGTADVRVSDSKTLLTETYKIKNETGYVEGTYFSYLTGSEVDLENEVIIDGTCYQFSDNYDMESLLGYEVNYYYMEDVSGYRRDYIAYCEPRKDKNKEYDIMAKDIVSLTADKIVYTDSNDKEKTLTFDGSTLISYNGKPYYELSDVSTVIKEGHVKVVTHESSTKASAVMIQEQFDGLFDRYNKSTYQVIFQNSMTVTLPELKFDTSYHTRLTLDGKTITPEELLKNDAITYCVSKDGQYIRGYVSRNVVSGTISTTRTEQYTAGEYKVVTLAGNEYIVSAYCVKDITSGFTSDFQITYDGRLLGTNTSTSNNGNYGYLIKFAAGDDVFESNFRVKILDKTGKINEYVSASKVNTNVMEKDDNSGRTDEAQQRSASFIINSGAFADAQLVVYEINSEGKLKTLYKAVDFTENYDADDDLGFGKYFSGEGRYSRSLIGNCAIEDSTIIFDVPFVDRDRDEDYTVLTKQDLADGSYTADIYDLNRGVANVMVIQDKEPTTLDQTADTLVVDKFATAWDEEKQEKVLEVNGWSKGEYISLKVDDDVSQVDPITPTETMANDKKDIKDLVRGDVIQYNLGSNGYLYTYRVLFNYTYRTSGGGYFESSTSQRDRLGVNNYKITNDKLMTVFGEVRKVFDYFMVESANVADGRFYRAYPTTDVNLYIYDTSKDEITIGEPFDIEPGNQVFIRTKYIDQAIDMLVIQ